MNLHISTLGKEIGHIMSSFKEYKIDMILLITSKLYENNALSIKNKLEAFNIYTDIIIIDPFNPNAFLNIISEIINYIKIKGCKYNIFFNITGGTNLMSSAALAAAQYTGGTAYYVLKGNSNDAFINVPLVKLSIKDSLTDKQKIIFNIIYNEAKDGEIVNFNKLAEKYGISKQKMGYYIQKFEELNLVFIDRTSREYRLVITDTGNIIYILSSKDISET